MSIESFSGGGSGGSGGSSGGAVGSVGMAEATPAISAAPSIDTMPSASSYTDFSSWQKMGEVVAPSTDTQVDEIAMRSSMWQEEVRAQEDTSSVLSWPKMEVPSAPTQESLVHSLVMKRGYWEPIVLASEPALSTPAEMSSLLPVFDVKQWQTVGQGRPETQVTIPEVAIDKKNDEIVIPSKDRISPPLFEASEGQGKEGESIATDAQRLADVRAALVSLQEEMEVDAQTKASIAAVTETIDQQESIGDALKETEEKKIVMIVDPIGELVVIQPEPLPEDAHTRNEIADQVRSDEERDSIASLQSDIVTVAQQDTDSSETIVQAVVAEAVEQETIVAEPEAIGEALVEAESVQEIVTQLETVGVSQDQAVTVAQEVLASAVEEQGVAIAVQNPQEVLQPLVQRIEAVTVQQQTHELVTESGNPVTILNGSETAQHTQTQLLTEALGEQVISAEQLEPEQVVHVITQDDTSSEVSEQVFGTEGKRMVIEEEEEPEETKLVFIEAIRAQKAREVAVAQAIARVAGRTEDVGEEIVDKTVITKKMFSPIAPDADGSLEQALDTIEKEVKSKDDTRKIAHILFDNAPVTIDIAPPKERVATEAEVRKVLSGRGNVQSLSIAA